MKEIGWWLGTDEFEKDVYMAFTMKKTQRKILKFYEYSTRRHGKLYVDDTIKYCLLNIDDQKIINRWIKVLPIFEMPIKTVRKDEINNKI